MNIYIIYVYGCVALNIEYEIEFCCIINPLYFALLPKIFYMPCLAVSLLIHPNSCIPYGILWNPV